MKITIETNNIIKFGFTGALIYHYLRENPDADNITKIAKDLTVTRRTVQKFLAEMSYAGILKVIRRADDGRMVERIEILK